MFDLILEENSKLFLPTKRYRSLDQRAPGSLNSPASNVTDIS